MRGDLDTIVLKALEKDRDRRYASAAALAEDIRHYLSGEPTTARPPAAWACGVRWALRHPKYTTATVCLLIAAAIVGGTFLSVSYLRQRPQRLVVDADASAARLVSAAGDVLQAWHFAEINSIPFAQLVQPSPPANEPLAILGFARGPLCVYRIERDFRTPWWRGQFTDEDLPLTASSGDPRLSTDAMAGITCAALANVFDDPGDELVVVHQHGARTHSAIRVYRLDGLLLYQIWVDANIQAIRWLPSRQLLVCAGLNGEHLWVERGVSARGHPSVVFAVHPVRGFCKPIYMTQEQDARDATDERLRPVWYRCVLPNGSYLPSYLNLRGATTHGQAVADDELVLGVSVRELGEAYASGLRAEYEWILDAHGAPVGPPMANDIYQMCQAVPTDDPRWLPAANTWRLGDLPPPVPSASAPK